MNVLFGFFLILLFNYVGAFLSKLSSLPIAGPVIGLILLLGFLLILDKIEIKKLSPSLRKDITKAPDLFLRHLALFFIPAGVGVITHFELIKNDLTGFLALLIFPTLLCLIFSMILFRWLRGRKDGS